jgi:peptidoglycan/LPS O-acetylase OafA/YrhL
MSVLATAQYERPFGAASAQIVSARNVHLQHLRGIAAVMVMLFHASVYLTMFHGDNTFAFFDERLGTHGVVFFFALSGYLMSDLIGKQDRFEFLASRILRIYPPFLLIVALSMALYSAFGMDFFMTWVGLLLMPYVPNGWMPLHVEWTLLYEMTFYVALFLVAVAGLRRFIPWFAIGWLGMLTVVAFARGNDGWNIGKPVYEMLTMMPNLAFAGGLLIPQLRIKVPASVGIGVCLVSLVSYGHLAPIPARYLASIAALVLVAAFAVKPKSENGPISIAAAKLGDWSYSLYLCHAVICIFVYRLWPHEPPVAAFLTAVSLSLLAAAIFGEVDLALHRRAKSALKGAPRFVVTGLMTAYVATFIIFATVSPFLWL